VTYDDLEPLRDEPGGAAWLAALPTLVAECVERWSLEVGEPVGEPFGHGLSSLAMPATLPDGTDAVLKVELPHREAEWEARALQVWDGDGAVRLLDEDPTRCAFLLERAVPGTHLTTVGATDPDAALDVVIGLLPRLWKPAGAPFRSLADEAADLQAEMLADWDRTDRTVDARLVGDAAEAFSDLAAAQGEQVLVNQDLHASNILSATREPWLVIDPKPLAGEREFGVAAIVRGGELGHSRAAVIHRLDRVSVELELDRERVRRWTMAHTLSWGFDANGPMGEHVETATWLHDAR
jgi:streptomycin 6-kinase